MSSVAIQRREDDAVAALLVGQFAVTPSLGTRPQPDEPRRLVIRCAANGVRIPANVSLGPKPTEVWLNLRRGIVTRGPPCPPSSLATGHRGYGARRAAIARQEVRP
jgi:hypothetical protein